MSPKPRLAGLDLLRVLAVAFVLGRHVGPVPADVAPAVRTFFEAWHRGGWVGVDLFFVLSGFLVSGLLFAEYRKRGSISPLRFYVRRGWKIYPPFFLLIGVTIAVHCIWGRPPSTTQLLSETLFLQSYLRGLWNHTWSLAVEEHFYFLLPILLLAFLCFSRGTDPFRFLPHLVAGTGVMLLLARIANAWLRSGYSEHTHVFATHLRLDSLFAGVAIAYACHFHADWFRRTFHARRGMLIVAGTLMLAPAFLLNIEQNPLLYTGGLTFFYLGSAALLIGVLMCELPDHWSIRTLAAIGTFSYSIYLWHMPVSDWGMPLVERIAGTTLPFGVKVVLYMAGSVAIGIGMARLIEVPMLRLRDRWFPAKAEALNQRAQAAVGEEARQEATGAPEPVLPAG